MKSVSCVSRAGWFGGKFRRLEIVVVGLNLRTFFDRIAQVAEDADNLVHRLDDGMLRAEGTANAGEGDVERRSEARLDC